MKRKRTYSSLILVATLLCGSLLFPVKAEAPYDWSKPRPSTGTIYDETIGKSVTDGIAEVDMGIHIYQYVEGVSDEYDYIHFKVSASANARMGIQYDVYEEDYYYQWVDVSEPTGITVDDGGVKLSLWTPFLYYGVGYESIWVCSNGFVTLNKTAANPNPQSIPNNSEPNPVIAVFWRNLHPEWGGSITYGQNVYHKGKYYFVVSWNNVSDDNGDPQTFQLLIENRLLSYNDYHHEIIFQYKSITKTYPTTVGVEDQTGNKGTSYNYNNLSNQTRLRFIYPTKGYRLERLYIKLTKSDNYARVGVEEDDVGGYNVVLEKYTEPFGNTFEFAIKKAASYALEKAGIIWKAMLITAEFAYALASDLSPTYNETWGGVKDAYEGDNEAYVWAQCWHENYSVEWKPFDSTLATTILWKFTDANSRDHVLTVTAEAWYRDLTNDGLYTVSTSATLEMHIGSKLSISTSAGGTTNPAPGTYAYEKGSSVTVTAIAYSGWHFDFWILDGTPYYQNPITVVMDSDHTLTAYFGINGGGGGGGDLPCPTLFVWNGSLWVDYGVIDIHNSTGEDVIREVSILKEDVGVNSYKAKFRLREGWEGLNFSESVIDQVKLYAVDSQGNRFLCPLIKAEHSTLGKVLPQLLLSDDYRVQMLLLETIDLTFTVPYPTSQIQGYIFIIEGCNMYKQ